MIGDSKRGRNGHDDDRLPADRPRGVYRNFPNEVAKDNRLIAENLAILALRSTFAGDGFAFNTTATGAGVPLSCNTRGLVISRHRMESFFRVVKAAGYLERTQFGRSYARERLTLPEPPRGYRAVRQAWFDGSMTLKEIGVLIYIRANKHTFLDQIAKRFAMPKRGAAKIVRELEKLGHVISARDRDQATGRIGSKWIVCAEKAASTKYQFTSNQFTSNQNLSNTLRKNSSHNKNSTRTSLREDHVVGDADRPVREEDFDRAWSDRALLGWLHDEQEGDWKDQLAACLTEYIDAYGYGTAAVYDEGINALAGIVTPASHRAALEKALRLKPDQKLSSKAGAATVIWYAAAILGVAPQMNAADAAAEVYLAIEKRFGLQTEAEMASFQLTGWDVAKQISAERFVDYISPPPETFSDFWRRLRHFEGIKHVDASLIGDDDAMARAMRRVGITKITTAWHWASRVVVAKRWKINSADDVFAAAKILIDEESPKCSTRS